ncbi:MAG: hypothetical protein ACTSQG_05130, partial [Promethearchaeota archaeon]
MEFTPQSIYEAYQEKILDKKSAIEQLITLIENSNYQRVRLESIKFLGKIPVHNNAVFGLLENLLISDKSESIRNVAAQVLKKNYLNKSLVPMKWALQHDDSPYSLRTIFMTLIKITKNLEIQDNLNSRAILIEEIKKSQYKEFNLGFEILCETRGIEKLSIKELAEILINYYTFLFLKRAFWRLKYKIKNCRIIELD